MASTNGKVLRKAAQTLRAKRDRKTASWQARYDFIPRQVVTLLAIMSED
jgi:hypothetical protein